MKQLLKRGIIGCNAEVIGGNNKALVGINGKIIDETKNILVIDTNKGRKRIIKNTVTLKINGIEVKGTELIGNVDERIKKKVKK